LPDEYRATLIRRPYAKRKSTKPARRNWRSDRAPGHLLPGDPVEFIGDGNGRYRVCIDGLELVIWNTGYHLIMWDEVADSPCDYDGCQEGIDEEACIKQHGKCPREFIERSNVCDDLMNGLSSFSEVESVIRLKLRKPHHELETQYPRFAASRIANEPWELSD
jgi:hypothetical protein